MKPKQVPSPQRRRSSGGHDRWGTEANTPDVGFLHLDSHRQPIDGQSCPARESTAMFQFSGGLLAGQHDNKKERSPPARPTPVTFPSLNPPEPSLPAPPQSWTGDSGSGVAAHFLGLKKPSDVSLDTLAILNVSFQPECDFETLLGSISNDAQSYLPPRSWFEAPDQNIVKPTESATKILCNGRRVPDHNEFYMRAKEISFSNQDAFANLTRKPMGEKVPLRLAHFRKFWEGLDNMAYYWDNSLDEYLPPKLAESSNNNKDLNSSLSPDEEEPRKKAKTEPTMPSGTAASNTASKVIPANAAPPKGPWEANAGTLPEKPVDLSKGSYKGYRIGNGAEMPDPYRLETVRAFMEPITWAFGATLVPHRRPPVLLLEHVRFPVRVSTVAWRGPQDRIRARQGWMEGPLLGVQCRADTSFGSTGDLQADSVLDTVRELGGLLLLAQERAREGKTEKRGGEGKWWTMTHRWGGGPGGGVGEAKGASDAPAPEPAAKADQSMPGRSRDGSKIRRRPTPADIWKTLKPGNPLWDPKVVYEAIGKDRKTAWDDVFLVSSLNHHISILKLRVHPDYLRFLAEGTLPQDPADPDWCSPKLQRTRWFDLFDIDDRAEAMRGIWGIVNYLMRGQEEQDVPMADT
ncbi:hypothetical protein P171DRAFT_484068 [Karstenula rhodostoma CBS 690.94]|uniref:Uncharacterized protein n=1 Tax=Karstenula rhodostoma CBS 690.94 TaxID=1392251 RepID=A0A9P4PK15_9PLEO|nr:hypothetical protein P171DRAFT_484068 [Karstenula rhodostoma CBS 690.94]